jgi:tRNA-specific 2-thiouridylase
MKPTIAVAISGGIDSLVAGYLLKHQGYDIIGIHFQTGFGRVDPRPVAKQLQIPFEIIDIGDIFHDSIIAYFAGAYRTGKTPNPCLLCNPVIKFGFVLDHAGKLGASHLATGHYAQINRDPQGHYHLLRGLDPVKDQTYFLSRLTQRQLAQALFPLGKYTKEAVRSMALDLGLKAATDEESQDICFIDEANYSDFLIDRCGLKPEPGLIVDVRGNKIGRHQGLHRFTIGQRRGINCPAAEPYYVVQIDIPKNRLVVGFKKDLLSTACRVIEINWIADPPASSIEVCTRVRYRHKSAQSTLHPVGNDKAEIIFEQPQEAITPGQGAVFYRDDEVLGGGWIV